MKEPVELSRRFLSDTGGWKEMKEARALHAAGKVSEASWKDNVLEGLVSSQGKNLRVRMDFKSRIDVENHCPCYRARREGIICAHGLAIGLEILEPTERKQSAPTASSQGAKPKPSPISPAWPKFTEIATDDSVPATLHLVFPPNLASAWSKGRLAVGIEIDLDGDRRLLSAVKNDSLLCFDTIDAELYRHLQALSPDTVPGMARLSTDDLTQLFSRCPGHPGFTLGKTTRLHISYLPYRPKLKRGKGLKFTVVWPEEVTPLLSGGGIWALTRSDLIQPVAPGLDAKWQGVSLTGLTIDASEFESTFRALSEHFETDLIELARPSLDTALEIEGSLNHLDLILTFRYGDRAIPAAETRDGVWVEKGILHLAETRAENAMIDAITASGFVRRGDEGRFVLKDKAKILQFLAYEYPRLSSEHTATTGERFDHALGQVEPIETSFDFRPGGEDWFAMEVGFSTPSGDTVSRQEIDRLLQMGQSSKQTGRGKIAVLDTQVAERLSDIVNDTDPEQLQPGLYQIDRAQAGYLRETAADEGFATKGAVPLQTSEEGVTFYDLSESLTDTLRPYQLEGVRWMQSLASQGMGGILADDMGLGKTLQTLSFIYSIGGTTLVICPSSLVYNWVEEAEKFIPEMTALAIEGPNRAKVLAEQGPDADILVTSYALLRRDEKLYADYEFDTVILDEAQHIKNPDAQVSKAAHRIPGTYRFALTGTPIENSVRDLWSISQFALPGYLGSRKDFTERFEKPLSASQPDTSTRERLSRRLRPVILRRLKTEVAKDLPEKVEQVIYCDLKPTQQEVYAKLLRESKASILQAEGGRQRMLALTALLRLRQTCCDLRLLGLNEIEPDDASIKADVLGELLEEALDGGHRVLIFSQFVEMLQLLVPELAAKKVDFCYLDGQTKNRGDVVKRFQTQDVPVFLISLKAGGVGLNLTGADTVIHVDPWWNPAVEAQATDRAHRIGQDRVVTSYKLITRGTVEEKILALQNRKREMTAELLTEAGDAGLRGDELMSLFE